MEKIEKKIVGWGVVPVKEAKIDVEVQAIIDTPDEAILANTTPKEIARIKSVIDRAVNSVTKVRPRRLDNTWRLKPPYAEHSLRVTLVANITPEGKKVPYEILLNTKNPETFMHLQAHALVISSYFREAYKTGISLKSLIQTLKDVFDPKYPSYRVKLKDSDEKPTLVHSIVAEIGYVIEEFYEECLAWNYSNSSQENPPTVQEQMATFTSGVSLGSAWTPSVEYKEVTVKQDTKLSKHDFVTESMLDISEGELEGIARKIPKNVFLTTPTTKSNHLSELWQQPRNANPCPKCGSQLTKQSGCDTCLDCGYSKCG